jgi:uncharacterized protein (TIRG00374 family)
MKLDRRSLLGIAISVAVLWFTLRGVSPAEVGAVLRASHWPLFAACTAVATCIFPLRARRWRTILEPVAGPIAFGPLWRATAIGMMMNNVFPLRAGEFARAFALTREVPRVPLTASLGSLAVDRIFDAIVLFAMMFGAMLDPAFPGGATLVGRTVPQLAAGGIGLVAALLAACYAVVLQHERVLRLVSALARGVAPRHEPALVRLVEHGVGGLAVLKDTRRFVAVLWWAVAHWLVHAAGLWLGFLAVGLEVPFSAALFLQGVLGIGVALPSSPGFFGVFEGAATVGLAVYGVPRELAVSWAIGYHLLSFIPITVLGALYFARLRLSASGLARGAQATA